MAEPIHINDIDDERLADYRDLRDADLRGSRKLFTVESPRVLARFLDSDWPVESLLLEQDVADALAGRIEALDAGVPVYVSEPGSLRSISGYGFHGGALALGKRARERSGMTHLDEVVQRSGSTILAAEGVVHVDNMGSLFRNAACLGADGIMLSSSCADPLFRKTVRISMGRVFTVPWTRVDDLPAALDGLRTEQGFQVVGLETGSGSRPLDELATSDRMVLLVGAEGDGLSEAARAACDQVLEIPMSLEGEAGSLNVSIASAIGLHELGRRRRGQDLDRGC